LVQTPTDSEEKKPVHQFIQMGETKKERKKGRKSHSIEETETLCDFQITKTPATNRAPQKESITVTTKLYYKTQELFY